MSMFGFGEGFDNYVMNSEALRQSILEALDEIRFSLEDTITYEELLEKCGIDERDLTIPDRNIIKSYL